MQAGSTRFKADTLKPKDGYVYVEANPCLPAVAYEVQMVGVHSDENKSDPGRTMTVDTVLLVVCRVNQQAVNVLFCKCVLHDCDFLFLCCFRPCSIQRKTKSICRLRALDLHLLQYFCFRRISATCSTNCFGYPKFVGTPSLQSLNDCSRMQSQKIEDSRQYERVFLKRSQTHH